MRLSSATLLVVNWLCVQKLVASCTEAGKKVSYTAATHSRTPGGTHLPRFGINSQRPSPKRYILIQHTPALFSARSGTGAVWRKCALKQIATCDGCIFVQKCANYNATTA